MSNIITAIFVFVFTVYICTRAHNKTIPEIKTNAVKEYIQHPENFKVYQIKDDTVIVDIKVEYLK